MEATIEGRLDGRHALVVTPFLPVPADAGQRKRVMQFNAFLRRAGCRITMLHYAVEQPFSWAHHDGVHVAAEAMVDELITVHTGPSFGRAPAEGGAHRLDEWWDPLLGETVQRLLSRRWFDIVVVNNVWLTKVFDAVPPGAARVLETHDVFSDRIGALRAIGQAPDFFVCERPDEAFGWNRADVVVAISDLEHRTIAAHVKRATSVPLPYAEDMAAPRRRGYVHPEKVVFGFFGSAHPFNVHGLKALIGSLAEASRWAPVELMVAGEVGRALTPDEAAMVTDIGYVESPDEFYDRIDIFVSPLDFGSGLKIKVVEAISKGVPTLVTEHSAIGTGLEAQLVVKDAIALAAAMASIAQRRPDLGAFADALQESQNALAESVAAGEKQLVDAIQVKQRCTIMRYAEFSLPQTDPRLWTLIGMVREFGNRGPVAIDLGDDATEPSWLRLLHPRVRLLGACEAEPLRKGESRPRLDRARLQDALTSHIAISNDPGYRVPGVEVHLHDARWHDAAPPAHATHVLGRDGVCRSTRDDASEPGFPWWSESVRWEPLLAKQRPIAPRPHVLVVVPAGASRAIRSLTSIIEHAARSTVTTVFLDADGALPFDVIRSLRLDPPSLVIELRWPTVSTLIGQWCAAVGLRHLASLQASQVLAVVRAAEPAPTPAGPSGQWEDALDRLLIPR